ncbi:MAG: helix-turn-helix transcriptional regulator [Bdellovibrionota bacterium]
MSYDLDMSDEIKIGKVLQLLLKQKNMSMRELAKVSGVPASNLTEWSANRSPKNPVQIKKVAEALGVTMHFLLFGEDDNQEPIQKILKEDFFSGTFEITVKKVKVK